MPKENIFVKTDHPPNQIKVHNTYYNNTTINKIAIGKF
jgi:hypothetical protein